MANVRPWHRNAPAKKAGATPKPRAWADSPRLDPWAQNDDGTIIPRDFRCVEAPDAGLKRVLAIFDTAPPAPRVVPRSLRQSFPGPMWATVRRACLA